MHKSTVVEILKNFSEEDIMQFSDFVISPFFNKNKNVSKLFSELKRHRHDFESDNLKKENVWKKIYPGKAFNYGVLKNLIHDLAKLLEEYMAIYKFRDGTIQYNHYLLNGIYDRQIHSLFPKKYSALDKKHEELLKENNVYHFYHIHSEIKHLNLVYEMSYKMNTDVSKEEYKFMAYRIVYFLCLIFRDYTDHIIIKMVSNSPPPGNDFSTVFFENFNNDSIDKIITLLKKDFPKEHKLLLAYRNMYLAYANQANHEHFVKFKESIFEIANIISKAELRIMVSKLQNLLPILQHNKIYETILFAESGDIYDLKISQDILLHNNGTLPEYEFNNYVTYLVRIKSEVKLKNFISKYSDKVAEPYKTNAYNYGMAGLMFVKNKFNEALGYVSKLDNDYLMMKFSIRAMQIKCYYEINDYEALIFLHNSLKKFDHKNKFGIKHYHTKLLHLCDFVHKLFKLKNSYDEVEVKILKDEIIKKGLNDSTWLDEKIIEIEASGKKYKKFV